MSPRPRKASDDEIFAAAVRVMGRVGPADLTLAAIASEAGLTAGALVQRFGSKLDLLREMSRRAASEPRDLAADFRAAHPSPLAALAAYARCFAALAPTPSALARNLAYFQLDLADRQLHGPLLRQAQATRAGYRTLVLDAVRAGELRREVDADTLARLIDTTVTGSLMTWAVFRAGKAADWIGRDLELALAPYLVPASGPAHRPPGGRGPRPRRRGQPKVG